MKTVRIVKQFRHSILAFALVSLCPGTAPAQQGHSHETAAQSQLTPSQGALLKVVRENTARFQDVSVAQAERYSLLFGCVSGPDSGAMGMHFVNLNLVASGIVDATRPQIVIYEPMPDFLVIASDWDKAHPEQGAPQLMGQLFHYFESPNRFGLPAFYTLHVWAWKDHPNGAFVNWHPNVSCQSFAGQ